MTFVVDPSVALKWFLADEPQAAEAFAVVRDGAVLIAPDLVIAETYNAAWRSTRLGLIEVEVAEIAAILPRFFDELISAATLAPRGVAIAAQLDHPVYDCLYIALAEARQIPLVTADARLLAKLAGSPWAANTLSLTDYRVSP